LGRNRNYETGSTISGKISLAAGIHVETGEAEIRSTFSQFPT